MSSLMVAVFLSWAAAVARRQNEGDRDEPRTCQSHEKPEECERFWALFTFAGES